MSDFSPEIVIGRPGTGKTTTLLGMIEDALARGVAPDRIGFVTFTKRGAKEAIDRAYTRFKLNSGQLRFFRTIHSLCFKAAGLNGGDILEGRKLVEFGDWLGVEISESFSMDEGTTFGNLPGDRALFMENLARVRCVTLRQQYQEYSDDLEWAFVERISRGLAEYKKNNHLVDYTDLLQMFVDGDWCPTLEELYVDEAQDLSQLQWRVIHKLAANTRGRVIVSGDDNQAIYKWSGADVDYFVDMPGNVTVLPQSYRVPRVGQRLAEMIEKRIRHRRPGVWKPRDAEGELTRIRSVFELDVMKDKDLLILGRNAYVLRPVLAYLKREGAIFEYKGHSSVSKASLEAIIAWEQLRAGKEISISDVKRVYAMMQSGSGVKRGFKTLPGHDDQELVDLKYLQAHCGLLRGTGEEDIWHKALDRMPPDEKIYMLRARQKGESLQKKPRVRVSTMHAIKGGEADHVVVLRDMAARTYDEMQRNPEDEARVQYVAATRFREKLTIVAPSLRTCYDL